MGACSSVHSARPDTTTEHGGKKGWLSKLLGRSRTKRDLPNEGPANPGETLAAHVAKCRGMRLEPFRYSWTLAYDGEGLLMDGSSSAISKVTDHLDVHLPPVLVNIVIDFGLERITGFYCPMWKDYFYAVHSTQRMLQARKGPALLLSDHTTKDSSRLHWRFRVTSTDNFCLGVVPASSRHNYALWHAPKHGPAAGFRSSKYYRGEKLMEVEMKNRIVNIVATSDDVTLVVEAEEGQHRQCLTVEFDKKMKSLGPLRLAFSCNAPGVVHLMTPKVHPNDMRLLVHAQDENEAEEEEKSLS